MNSLLPATEDQYRTFTDHLPLGVYRSTPAGKLVYANVALATMLEYGSVEELLQAPVTAMYADPDGRALWLQSRQSSQDSYVTEALLRTKGGRTIWVRDFGRTICTPDGRIAYFDGVVEDITGYKRSEDELQRLNVELERRNRTLHTLYEIGIDINAQLNMNELPRRIIERVTTLLDAEGAFLYLYDPATDVLRVMEATGIWELYIGRTLKVGEGLAGRVFQSGQSMFVNDYPNWEGRSLSYVMKPSTAVLSVPLRWRDEILGSINITRNGQDQLFTKEDIPLVEMLAAQAAVAIVNARIFEAEHRQREIAETLHAIGLILTSALEIHDTLNFLVQAAQVFFPQAATASVQLVDREGKPMRHISMTSQTGVPDLPPESAGVIQPILNHAIEGHRVINIGNIEDDLSFAASPDSVGFRSMLAAPLISGEHIWGTLSVTAQTVGAFKPEDENLADLLARQATVAIENAQLYDEINSHVSQLEQRVDDRTAQLQRVKERAEAILTQSSDAIILTHADSAIQQTNPAFNELFGYGIDEAFNYRLSTLLEPASVPKLEHVFIAMLQEKRPGRVEVIAKRKDGTTFAADMALSPITQQDGQVSNVVCSVRDITKRRQMEENLRNALMKEKQLSEFKSRFVSMVSHEFRTPLAIILSSSNILKKYIMRLPEKKRSEHLENIETQVKHLNNLLEDILTISRAETVGVEFKPQPINVAAFCRDIVEEIQLTTTSHRIVFLNEGDCDEALIDDKLMRQVIRNLLTNAIKYSPESGEVSCTLKCSSDDIAIAVRDTGIGIPEEDLQHIFESFHRAENVGTIPGTGLGLAITKLGVELHGGSIGVQSQPGSGTTFTLRIPRVSKTPDA